MSDGYTSLSPSKFSLIAYEGLNSNYTNDSFPLLITNIASVSNQLLNLIMTSPGEFDFEPDFGSEITSLLFELPSAVTSWMMENYLFVAIQRWLPFISIDFKNSQIYPLQDEANYYFKLVYSIQGIDNGQLNFVTQT